MAEHSFFANNRMHYAFMKQALDQAQIAAASGEVPVGAVVVYENRVIARGHNQTERLGDPTAHAEMLALTAACDYLSAKYLPDCTLYVTLEPCSMCAGAMVWSKLGKAVIAAQDQKAGACGSLLNVASHKRLNHRVELLFGVMEQESEQLLKRFFSRLRGGESHHTNGSTGPA